MRRIARRWRSTKEENEEIRRSLIESLHAAKANETLQSRKVHKAAAKNDDGSEEGEKANKVEMK